MEAANPRLLCCSSILASKSLAQRANESPRALLFVWLKRTGRGARAKNANGRMREKRENRGVQTVAWAKEGEARAARIRKPQRPRAQSFFCPSRDASEHALATQVKSSRSARVQRAEMEGRLLAACTDTLLVGDADSEFAVLSPGSAACLTAPRCEWLFTRASSSSTAAGNGMQRRAGTKERKKKEEKALFGREEAKSASERAFPLLSLSLSPLFAPLLGGTKTPPPFPVNKRRR